ncbi:phage head morphogenesis protein [Escherichia coli]|nr:phage head morphogenesis protein [Escherichia coli]
MQRAVDEGISQKAFIRTRHPACKSWDGGESRLWWTAPVTQKKCKLGSPRRLALIYNVNTRVAYNAGRYTQMMNNTDTHPFWQYVAVMDSRTRPAHSALNGLVFRYDDPFWNTHYPPNGWNCRCRVRPLSQPVWMQWGYPFHPVRIIFPPAMLRLAWISRPEKSEKCR